MSNVPEMYGTLVFNDAVMRERLPKETYKALRKTIQDGRSLDQTVANVVANAIRESTHVQTKYSGCKHSLSMPRGSPSVSFLKYSSSTGGGFPTAPIIPPLESFIVANGETRGVSAVRKETRKTFVPFESAFLGRDFK